MPVRTHAAYLAGALVGVIADWVGVGEASEAEGTEGAAPPEEAALAFWRLVRG